MIFQVKSPNAGTDLHVIVEAGYKYMIPHYLYKNLQLYLLKYDLMDSWYKQLSDKDCQKVQRLTVW